MRIRTYLTLITISVCALLGGAQTLTATYIELADSADYYTRHSRWADAERVIIKALRHEPANPSNHLLWSNLGIVREQLCNLPGALEAFDIGLASAPRSTTLLTNRARIYMSEGKSGEAIADLSRALEVDSTLQWPRKMRGILYLAQAKPKEALADFTDYKNRFGEDADVAEGAASAEAGLGNPDKAMEYYEESLRIEPLQSTLVKMLLTAYSFGILERYEEKLREGIEKYPRCGELYLLRGTLHKARYETEKTEIDRKLATEFGASTDLINTLLPIKTKK